MSRLVLIVDKEAPRRAEIAAALHAHGAEVLEADDPFSAMAALGQRAFDVLCAHAGPRHLSLRGLFQLAKRKKDDIAIWVYVEPTDRAAVELSFSGEADIGELSAGTAVLAARVLGIAPPGVAGTEAHAEPASGELPLLEEGLEVEVTEDLPVPGGLDDLDITEDDPASVAGNDDEGAQGATDAVARPRDTDDAHDVEAPPTTGASALKTPAGLDPPPEVPASDDGFDISFKTPPPAGAFDSNSGDENDDVDDGALLSTSGEGAPLPGGAETLIDAFARELTGRMTIGDGERAWQVYLYGGEPAWVHPPGGDAAVFERLVAAGKLPPEAAPEPVPEGELMASLIENGTLTGEDAKSFMRQLLFDATLEVAGLDACTVEHEDAPQFLSTPPPFRVNPFGLVLEARRRRTRPDELLVQARVLREARVTTRRGLDKVYGKVAPFLRGVDVRSLLAEGATIGGFSEAAGIDDLLATQLVLALEAAGLVRVDRAAVSV